MLSQNGNLETKILIEVKPVACLNQFVFLALSILHDDRYCTRQGFHIAVTAIFPSAA